MTGPVLVGIDSQPQSAEALRTADQLARVLELPLVAANVYELDRWYAFVDATAIVDKARSRATDVVRAAVGDLAGAAAIDQRVVGAPSPAHGLHELAAELRAELLVVGTSHRKGIAQRLLPGGTAEQLLHGAPCPILVSRGRELGDGPLAVGYDGTPESERALAWAGRLAGALARHLVLINVTVPTTPRDNPEIYAEVIEYMHGIAAQTLAGGVERVPHGIAASTTIAEGDPGEQIAARAEEQGAAIAICGSRGFGPARAVMMGSTARSLISHAATPVLVVPRPS
jgi:nucleotide-binding universal stress UspA family protein